MLPPDLLAFSSRIYNIISDFDLKLYQNYLPKRIIHPITKRPATEDDFVFSLYRIFQSEVYSWCDRLLDPTFNPDWHLIHINPDMPLHEVLFEEDLLCGIDFVHSLAFLIGHFENRYQKITKIERIENGLHVYGADTLIAKIKRITFHDTPELETKRTETALKGVRHFSSNAEFTKSFRKLPFFNNVNFGNPIDEITESVTFEPLLITPGNLCREVQRILDIASINPIPLNVTQEIVASIIGMDSWQHLIGIYKRKKQTIQNVCGIINDKTQELKLTNGIASGITAFGNDARKHNISLVNTARYDNHFIFSTDSYPEDCPIGLSLYKLRIAFASDVHLDFAKRAASSSDLGKEIQNYLFSDLAPNHRILKINERNNLNPQHHVNHNGWIYFLDNSSQQILHIIPDGIDNVDHADYFSAYKDKSSIMNINGEYWISTDWDCKPKRKLFGMNQDGVKLIEKKLGIYVFPEA